MIYGDDPEELRKDPLGLSVYVPNGLVIRQSTNLYAYCINNPIMFLDPSGRFADVLQPPNFLGLAGALASFGTSLLTAIAGIQATAIPAIG